MRTKILLTALFTAMSILTFAQCTISNSGMENWTSGDIQTPLNWDSPDSIAQMLAPILGITIPPFVTLETVNVSEGSSAAKLVNHYVTSAVINLDVPGALTTGKFMVDILEETFETIGGVAIDCRPNFIFAALDYLPVNGDTAYVQAIFYKGEGVDTIRIGEAEHFLYEATSGYQNVEIWVDWLSDEAPDFMQLTFSTSYSSNPAFDGSILYVDSAGFSVGIRDEFLELQPVVYPVPSDGRFSVFNPYGTETTMEIYDLSGRLVQTFLLQPQTNMIKTSGLESGLYLYSLLSEKSILNSGKIQIY